MAAIVSSPRSAGTVLEASELYRFYHAGDDETFALRGVSLAAVAGEILAVVGPSGSGKSTLLACLAGLDEPDGGYVSVAGTRITRRPEAERAWLRARWIGVLRQSGNLLDHLSVGNNIRVAQNLVRDVDRAEASVASLLGDVGLAERAHARPATLSGGEAARAGLAVALANDPPLLLADEPTGEVDQANERLILDLLRRRAESGRAVVIVTHSTRAALEADRIVHLHDGRIVDA
ncbi:MAG: ATP-binding cassette domain-containing protein [Actinomycetota bacterium]|nr:ATP-binding cassette domain-containing protein [Actinomycetota bacterium]